jgi:hypothetical protein
MAFSRRRWSSPKTITANCFDQASIRLQCVFAEASDVFQATGLGLNNFARGVVSIKDMTASSEC